MLRWLLLTLFVLLTGCAGKRAGKHADYAPAPAYAMEEAAAYGMPMESSRSMMADGDYADEAMPPPPPSPEPAAPETPTTPTTPETPAASARMVHYDGYVRLRVTRVDEGVDAVRAVAEALGGLVERVTASSVVVRVPVARFQEGFDQVLALGEVLDKTISARDVTEAYTSVDLRRRTAQATLERLQQLLARSQDEKERLQLLRQIEQLTQELDRLDASLRTLASLASLSRISVDLVPREALAWQGPEDETQELAWIRQLSPFRTEAPVESRVLHLPVPEGMVRLERRGPYVAEAADGARIWSHRVENAPEGDAAFWMEAISSRLSTDFASAAEETVGGWRTLRLVSRDDQPYTWLIAVRVEGRRLHLVQAWLPSEEAAQRHDAALRAVLSGGAA